MNFKKIKPLPSFLKTMSLGSILFISANSYAALPNQCPDLSNFAVTSTANEEGTSYNTSILGSAGLSDVWYGELNGTPHLLTASSFTFILVSIVKGMNNNYYPNCNYLVIPDGVSLSLTLSQPSSPSPYTTSGFTAVNPDTPGEWSSFQFYLPTTCKPPHSCTFTITP